MLPEQILNEIRKKAEGKFIPMNRNALKIAAPSMGYQDHLEINNIKKLMYISGQIDAIEMMEDFENWKYSNNWKLELDDVFGYCYYRENDSGKSPLLDFNQLLTEYLTKKNE